MPSYEEKNCHSLINLTILDPPRWGWSASGGIVDVLPPHEAARRRKGRRDFINSDVREKKRLKKENTQQAATEGITDGSKKEEEKSNETSDSKAPPIAKDAVIVEQAQKVPSQVINAPTVSIVEKESDAHKTAEITSSIHAENSIALASTTLSEPSQTMNSTTDATVASQSSLDKSQSNSGETIASKGTQRKDSATVNEANTNANENQKEKKGNGKKETNLKTKYDYGPQYNIIPKTKGRSKRDKFDIEVVPLKEDGTVHPDAYHRGLVGHEPRLKGGQLLCDIDKTDTNYGYDVPRKLVVKVKIEFPLCEPEWSDDEDDDDNKELLDASQGVRRNARRGEKVKPFVSETERRIRREEKLKNIPRYRDIVQFDLSNPKTPTPMLYASDIATEFGLSLCTTLDLARSIQTQIDSFVKQTVNYHVPISEKDHLLQPRGKNSLLQPPKYTNPKILHGGHCATNVTTVLKPFEVRNVVNELIEEGDAKTGGTKIATTPKEVKVTEINFDYDVAKPEEIPQHDISKLNLDRVYLDTFMERARDAVRRGTKVAAGGDVGKLKIIKNGTCHFCHKARNQVIQFTCGNVAHCYCDLHTCRRLGFKLEDATLDMIDYCPVCSLQCTCYRCSTKVTTLLPQFATACRRQGVTPADVEYDFIFNCSRTLHKTVKDACTQDKKKSSSRRKSSTPTNSRDDTPSVVPKVPKEEFPNELSGGINKDPSSENDYFTIFEPDGKTLLEDLRDKARKEVPVATPVVSPEIGNVDYCVECSNSGDFIYCVKCPRTFHADCIKSDQKSLEEAGQCPKCIEDSSEMSNSILNGDSSYDKLLAVFQQHSSQQDFEKRVRILSKIHDMIKVLSEYDFGSIFSEPVDVKLVRDYKKYVKRPMDLGTISMNLLNGTYCKATQKSRELVDTEKATDMDIIIFNVVKDIEQVWQNCFLYNREGSSFHRMGQVLQRKAKAISNASFYSELDPFVTKNLVSFIEICDEQRSELSNSLNVWIPKTKYSVNVSQRGPPTQRTTIGIYDPDTHMVVKQYSSYMAASIVCDFLSKLGHKQGMKVANRQRLRELINASAKDPGLLLFGYRWIPMDLIRSGSFVASPKIDKVKLENAVGTDKSSNSKYIIHSRCKISGAILKEFQSIEDAHKHWSNYMQNSFQVGNSAEGDTSLAVFKLKYLDGDGHIDSMEWNWIGPKNESKTEKSTTEKHSVINESSLGAPGHKLSKDVESQQQSVETQSTEKRDVVESTAKFDDKIKTASDKDIGMKHEVLPEEKVQTIIGKDDDAKTNEEQVEMDTKVCDETVTTKAVAENSVETTDQAEEASKSVDTDVQVVNGKSSSDNEAKITTSSRSNEDTDVNMKDTDEVDSSSRPATSNTDGVGNPSHGFSSNPGVSSNPSESGRSALDVEMAASLLDFARAPVAVTEPTSSEQKDTST